jgi:hypothetical protein
MVRGAGCSFCRGKLHAANYDRKPRGGPEELDPEFSLRRSFCCAVDGCRRRHTPPSFRFLGRRVYLAAVFILAAAMQQGPTPVRVQPIRDRIGQSANAVSLAHLVANRVFSRVRSGKRPKERSGYLSGLLICREPCWISSTVTTFRIASIRSFGSWPL